MDRRSFLTSLGVTTSLGFAGCLGREDAGFVRARQDPYPVQLADHIRRGEAETVITVATDTGFAYADGSLDCASEAIDALRDHLNQEHEHAEYLGLSRGRLSGEADFFALGVRVQTQPHRRGGEDEEFPEIDVETVRAVTPPTIYVEFERHNWVCAVPVYVVDVDHGREVRDEPEEEPPEAFTDPDYTARFAPHAPWENHGGNPAGTHHNPDSELPDGDVDAAWLRWLDHAKPSPMGPVTDDRHVYVGHNDPNEHGMVSAYDGETGERAWQTVLEPPAEHAALYEWEQPRGMAQANGLVYYTAPLRSTGQSRLTALAAATGRIEWEVTVPGLVMDAPTADSGMVVLPILGHDGNGNHGIDPAPEMVYAFDHDGTERWRYDLDGVRIQRAVRIADHTVYAGLADGRVHALNDADGTPRWDALVVEGDRGTGIAIQDGFAADPDNDRLYVTGVDYVLYAVDTTDGSTVWNRHLSPEPQYGRTAPAVTDDTIYVNAGRGGLQAIDPATGKRRWQATDVTGTGTVATTQDGVINAAGNTVTAVDHDGHHRWSVDLPRPDARPRQATGIRRIAIAHNLIYTVHADRRLYAIGATNQ